jgi:hypothetical protein
LEKEKEIKAAGVTLMESILAFKMKSLNFIKTIYFREFRIKKLMNTMGYSMKNLMKKGKGLSWSK